MPSEKLLQKVLIIRFSSLGDIVLASLVIRCLKKQTGCEIHFLTKKSFKDLVQANPYVDKVWLLDKSIKDLIPDLQIQAYDLIIDLHKNLRSRLLRLLLWNVPVVSYHKANLAKWLSVNFKFYRFPKEHIAIRYLNALNKYNVHDDGEGLDYFIPSTDHVFTGELKIDPPFIALVIGAAHFTKRIPLNKLQALIASLPIKYPLVLIGGKPEYQTGHLLESDRIINTCGKYSINQSASILAQSSTVIAPDTGMMHIAAALKKPIRSIWGSTLPEFGFWPFYGNHFPDLNESFEIKNLECRPCARFGRDTCPKGHFKCMELQDVVKIAASVG